MQDKTICTVVEEEARDDRAILVLFTGNRDCWPWSVDELVRERGDRLAAIDAISRLKRAGLIRQTADDLVFPTRAAIHYMQVDR